MPSIVMLTIDQGSYGSFDYRFDEVTEIIVGRAKDCDLAVPDTAMFRDVALHHCLLRIDPPRIWVRDLESKNGTFVDDLKISSKVGHFRIYDEDVVQWGPVRMTVRIHEKETSDLEIAVGANDQLDWKG